MKRITLSEELRLIERSESEVSGAWKGAHLLLFFLAFVFGSFCTFCFHMLMYLFDEKCVLFPKLLSLTSLRHNLIYEFIPDGKEDNTLPVDFLSTQFVEKSACYLPTYVPLVSGIFGLVWTTMFLMCSSGSRSLSGLQRPWRVMPPVLVFSIAMSCLCIYSSTITHYGLRELCKKLGTVTGSSTCSYTVNVATLAYERQIRGVYQATRLTITSAWMHTACWIASAALAIARILLAVDFRLVKIRAELIGDLDKMLERDEKQLRTVMPSPGGGSQSSNTSAQLLFKNMHFETVPEFGQLIAEGSDILFISDLHVPPSNQGLLPEERNKSSRIKAYDNVSKEHRFIVSMLYDMLESLDYYLGGETSSSSSSEDRSSETIIRQFGQQSLSSRPRKARSASSKDTDIAIEVIKHKIMKRVSPLKNTDKEFTPGTYQENKRMSFESELNITPELRQYLTATRTRSSGVKIQSEPSVGSKVTEEPEKPTTLKSSLKTDSKDVGSQTERKYDKSKKRQKVTIASSKDTIDDDDSNSDFKNNKNTQTKPKEKQD